MRVRVRGCGIRGVRRAVGALEEPDHIVDGVRVRLQLGLGVVTGWVRGGWEVDQGWIRGAGVARGVRLGQGVEGSR